MLSNLVQAKDKRPNIIIILADDMGYSDLGAFGSEIDTPNLDELAQGGLRFSEFYNSGRCWPTRAALITGRYSEAITPQQTSIAKVLKSAGYQTGMVGKWHLSKKPASALSPTGQGFEHYYGTMGGAGSFYEPPFLTRDKQFIAQPNGDYYYTSKMDEEANRQIEKFAQSEKPFFQYLAYTAPHWPLHAPEGVIQKYLQTYQVGWDQLRQERYERMIKMGVIDKNKVPLPKKEPGVVDWKNIDHKNWRARNMAVYAAMVDEMDQSIGRVVETLKRTSEFENTLIVFLSDNGAANKVINQFNGKEGLDFTQQIGGKNSWGSVGPNWANLQNTPLRRYKNNTYNGGSMTPAIMHWPEGIKVKPGTIIKQRGHVVDMLATAAELAEATYPRQENGRKILPNEGISLTPILYGQKVNREHDYFLQRPNKSFALVSGDHKIVKEGKRPWALYNLKNDLSETNDLAAKYPKLTADMVKRFNDKKWLHPRPKNFKDL
ncbi:arylsulfatase [Thalassotalea sp. PLHSN55]|uniref:arylsulfatase n=1 Tax=Thalassotalea sp. PLHSN55 TaxID=3435888 RepID=UPI003F8740A2